MHGRRHVRRRFTSMGLRFRRPSVKVDVLRMWPRVAAVSVLAAVLASGCAGVRQRLLGPGVTGATELPEDAKPLGHFLRGQMALTQNDVPVAVQEFEKAIAEDPSTPWLRL